ncbi:hypothetical protein AGMMS50212_14110 [Spirochaetia bacterium]|nr:hypothetical protein AGMMS50212_14110 [Spirochaetia bacterium]
MIFAPVDVVFTLLIVILIIRSALHGFVDEVMGIASVTLGIFFAGAFFNEGAAFIRTRFMQNVKIFPEILSFIILFLIVFVLVKIITAILRDIIVRIKLSGLDSFLGALFGIIEGIVVVGIIIFVINIQPLFDKQKVLNESIYSHLLSNNVQVIQKKIIQENSAGIENQ